jgi:hypothetical protein
MNRSVELRPDDYIFVWTSVGYRPSVEIMSAVDVYEFVSEYNGFSHDEIDDILNMPSGTTWAKDIDGLVITKV